MKYKFTTLALIMTIPSLVWAGANFLSTDPVYVISKTDREDNSAPLIPNYRLQWNQAIGKFDLLPGDNRRPITIEESILPSLPISPSQTDEPIYYDDDISV